MKTKPYLPLIALSSALLSPLAISADPANDPLLKSLEGDRTAALSKFFSVTEKAEWLAKLPPSDGLVIIKLKSGEYMIVDSGLRYAFEAKSIVDIGNGQVVDDRDKVNQLWKVNVDALSTLPLPLFTYGQDKLKADFTVMVSMSNHASTKAVMDMIRDKQDDYRIDVMLMGTFDEVQLLSAGNLYCAEDRKLAKQRLLDLKFPLKSDKTTWLKQLPTCKHDDVISAFNVAQMYHVKKYPFFYNKNGASITGIPTDIDKFVEWNPTNIASYKHFDWDLQKGAANDGS